MKKFHRFAFDVKERVKKNFCSAILNFIFILAFVNIFQKLFGAENMIVAIIFIQIMLPSMVRDMTAAPVRHFFMQTALLLMMACVGFFVTHIPFVLAIPCNFIMIFIILYAYTYEYIPDMYFCYVLSYLFFIFIAQIEPTQLPMRMICVIVGSACIILYQLVNGRNRMKVTGKNVLLSMYDKADKVLQDLLQDNDSQLDEEVLHQEMYVLCKNILDRRKKTLCISDAAFAMIDCGRGLEDLILLLSSMEKPFSKQQQEMLYQVKYYLSCFKAYTLSETQVIPMCSLQDVYKDDEITAQLYTTLTYIRSHLLNMSHPQKQAQYQKTLLSLSYRWKVALNVSEVRFVYALRLALLMSLCIFVVQQFHLAHGKWLLFTIASVSLPYADDLGQKAKKRIIATIAGGLISLVVFSLISNVTIRSIIMLCSGFITFFLIDYSTTFTCATIGALGGAIMLNSFGIYEVGQVILIRLFYVVIGIMIAIVGNKWIYPFHKSKATKQLLKKYEVTANLLKDVCFKDNPDTQLYYNLIIQLYLLKQKFEKNAVDLNWSEYQSVITKCQETLRTSHRNMVKLNS